MTLGFAYLDTDPKYSAIPVRLANGGLDTGPQATGPWGNISVVPDAGAYSQNLLLANPPPHAVHQPVSYERPGNNPITYPSQDIYNTTTNPRFLCMKS